VIRLSPSEGGGLVLVLSSSSAKLRVLSRQRDTRCEGHYGSWSFGLALGIDDLASGQLNPTPCWAFTFRMAWAAGWFEEAVTWHTNNLIAEHASRTPAIASVRADMHANGWEGLSRSTSARVEHGVTISVVWELGVHRWAACILARFLC